MKGYHILYLIIVLFFASLMGISVSKRYQERGNTYVVDKRMPKKTDYQIDIHNDTIWLWDGERFVGRCLNTWDTPFGKLIEKDNN